MSAALLRSTCRRRHGFSLVELAVVLAITGLLLGGMLVSLSAQGELRATAAQQRQFSELIEALVGYAASRPGKPYLPCPDTDGDGAEDRQSDGDCRAAEGGLPWRELGVGREDAWGNFLRYRVAPAMSARSGFSLASTGELCVARKPQCPASDILGSALPAVIVAHGRNGRGGLGGGQPADDERENLDGDKDFVMHPPTQAGTAAGEFDDLLVWLSPNILFSRMIAAGKLP